VKSGTGGCEVVSGGRRMEGRKGMKQGRGRGNR